MNLEQRKGFKNRHIDKLPTEKSKLKIATIDVDGSWIFICEWRPFDKENYINRPLPASGYLGTAKVIEGQFEGIGFHAWENQDSDFIYYSIVD